MSIRLHVNYALISKALALLLLAAAALKVHALSEGPVAKSGIFSTPEAQLPIVEFEVILAFWLFSGRHPVGSWLTAFMVFSCFAVVSAAHGFMGQTSCGCFGRIKVSPWQAFLLDLVVLCVLALGRPDLSAVRRTWHRDLSDFSRTNGPWFAGVVISSVALLVSANLAFGSVPDAIAYFRGDRVSVNPRLVDVGEVAFGDKREVSVELTNRTDQAIRVIGGTTDCSCTVLNGLPVTIGPGETCSLTVSLSMTGKPGVINRKANFLIDDEGFHRIGFVVTGRIVGGTSAGR